MSERTGDAGWRDERAAEVLGDYLAAMERGEAPAPAVLMERHPEIAAELAAFFAREEQFAFLMAPLRVAVAAAREPEPPATDRDPTNQTIPSSAAQRPETGRPNLDETTAAGPPPGPGGENEGGDAGDGDAHEALRCRTEVRCFGDYELLTELGRGGMGIVYKARQISLNRLVALKMLKSDVLASEDELRRFQNEAEAVALLDHRQIVPILEIGEQEGCRYFSMKLISGSSLDHKLAEYTRDPRAAAALVASAAGAVHHAHQRGILHRDLKPANILLDEGGLPHVTDFGLAKRIEGDSELTQTGAIMGTPSYMSPEQASGRRGAVTTASDVYGLGAVFYALLTGRAPFAGDSVVDTIQKVREFALEPVSKHNPRTPADLEVICMKCLHKEPARRYESAQALGEDLERYLRGEPIKARPISLWERGAKWVRRRPLAAASWMLAALLLCGAIAGVLAYQRFLLHRSQTISAHVVQGYGLLHMADAARDDQALNDVRVRMSAFLPRIEVFLDDPQANQLSQLLNTQGRAVDRLLTAHRSDQAARERYRTTRDQFQRFRDLRNEAFIRDTQLTGLDLPKSRGATRGAALAALDLYAAPGSGDSWSLAPLPAGLTPAEREEVTDGCYELFLVLADAEPDGEQGLRHLVQAARLRRLPTAAYHLRRASCLARAGRVNEAKQARHEAASLEPVTAFDHFLSGQERFQRGDLSTAIQHFSAALQLRPDHFWAQCLLAVACLQLNHPSEAKAGLTACLQQQPDSAWLHLLRGFASYQFAVRAGELLERERSSAGGVLKTVIEFQLSAAASDYRRALLLLDQKPNDELRYALLVNRGLLGLERRDFAKAEADLEAAIRLAPRRLQAYPALALVDQKQGKFDQALLQYSRSIALKPDSAELYRSRADLELARPNSTTAQRERGLRDLDQAIRLEQPINRVLARDHTNRARLLLRDRHESLALAACDAAIRVAPDYEPAHALRLDLLLKLKRHDDIIRSLDPIIAGGKATAALYELRSLARREIRDFSGAIEDLTRAMSLRPDRSGLLRQRGWLYIVSDAPRLALHDFQEAIDLDPSSSDAYAGRGSARLRLGEHREAVADVEKALGLGEPSGDLCYKAARVYALADVVAGAEVRKKGSETVILAARYQDRAATLLRETFKRTPVAERTSFWRNIQSDPALTALHRRISSPDLAGPAAPAVKPGERRDH
jgi:tetratricopeptide (TPR) repeat protein/tRNA A-37 threonylcarbamoyl transferase component Bud32